MKIGLSTYSLDPKIASGEMSLTDALEWTARSGGECAELVPFAYTFERADGGIDDARIAEARRAARDAGVELVNYSVLADFCREGEALEAELARVRRQVDIAAALGLTQMRHDVCAFRRPHGENGQADFERWLPVMIDCAREITSYARGLGVRTMIENHGFFANGCDRVERVLDGVGDENYGLLLDTGNIICVDEDPSAACQRLAGRARMVHLKDFYVRKRDPGDATLFDCGGHWFRSRAGRYLRGAILGQGDLDVWEQLSHLKRAGYDGCLMVEFEGLEDPLYASAVSLQNARRIWNELMPQKSADF